nr:hypothetical protein [Methylobacterium sp. FF17]
MTLAIVGYLAHRNLWDQPLRLLRGGLNVSEIHTVIVAIVVKAMNVEEIAGHRYFVRSRRELQNLTGAEGPGMAAIPKK